MSTIVLTLSFTASPDFDGFLYYVENNSGFDARDFADVYNLNYPDIDCESIDAVNDAVAQLYEGEWAVVGFEKAD
jgi:hypothetical protein